MSQPDQPHHSNGQHNHAQHGHAGRHSHQDHPHEGHDHAHRAEGDAHSHARLGQTFAVTGAGVATAPFSLLLAGLTQRLLLVLVTLGLLWPITFWALR